MYEQGFSTEIFWVFNVTQIVPHPVYELTDLQDRPIEGLFYNCDIIVVLKPCNFYLFLRLYTNKIALKSTSLKNTIKMTVLF